MPEVRGSDYPAASPGPLTIAHGDRDVAIAARPHVDEDLQQELRACGSRISAGMGAEDSAGRVAERIPAAADFRSRYHRAG